MDIRYSISPNEGKMMGTKQLRENFLVEDLFVADEIKMTYTFDDRMIAGGCMPVNGDLVIDNGEETGTDYFMQMREMGILNIGGKGIVSVDGVEYTMEIDEALYVAKESKEIVFKKSTESKFYFVSVPAHRRFETKLVSKDMVKKVELGSNEESNIRTIFQYVHPAVLESCQLLMGMTVLEPCNVWNTMPMHTHLRRMETYFYCKMPEDAVVMHIMGEGDETRHVVVRNEQAVISPSWSVHSGVGTTNYAFVWGMAGENKTFTDMQGIDMKDIK